MAGDGSDLSSQMRLTATVTDFTGEPVPNIRVDFISIYADATNAGTLIGQSGAPNDASHPRASALTDAMGKASVLLKADSKVDRPVTLRAYTVRPLDSAEIQSFDIPAVFRAPVALLEYDGWVSTMSTQQNNCRITLLSHGEPVAGRKLDVAILKVARYKLSGEEVAVTNPQDFASLAQPSVTTDALGVASSPVLWHPPTGSPPGPYYVFIQASNHLLTPPKVAPLPEKMK